MVSYSIISELIINILQVLLIRKMMELFLPAADENKKKMGTVFCVLLFADVVLISIFHRAAVYGICNYLSIIGLTLFYQGSWKKRFWVSLAIFATDLACALVVYFAFCSEAYRASTGSPDTFAPDLCHINRPYNLSGGQRGNRV